MKNANEEFYFKESPKGIEWNYYEFEYHKKDFWWFFYLWLFSIAVFLILLYLKNISAAILIVFLTTLIHINAAKIPEIIKIQITENGIKIKDAEIPFEDIKSFWIDKDSRRLIINTNSKINPKIVIMLNPSVNDLKIRKILDEKEIEMKEETESLNDFIVRKIKF